MPACRVSSLERAALAIVCAANAIILLRSPAPSLVADWPGLPARLAWAAPPFVALAASALLPAGAYLRLRPWLVPLLRLVFHLHHSERSSTASAAGLLLHSDPRPGAKGAALDALRILLGTRVLPNALVTLLFPLPGPLLAVAAVHVAIVRLTVSNRAYCATPLLSHPLTRQRLRWLAAGMHNASALATPMGTSLAKRLPATCEDTLAFLQATHAVLPVVLLSWQSADSGGAPGAAFAAAAGGPTGGNRAAAWPVPGRGPAEPVHGAQQGQQAQQAQRPQQQWLRRWWWQPGAAPGREVWSTTDAWVRTLCGARLGALGRLALVLWLVTALFVVATF